MAVRPPELNSENSERQKSLLMDRPANLNGHEQVITASHRNDASASISIRSDHSEDAEHSADRPSTSNLVPASQLTSASPSGSISDSLNFPLPRRGDSYSRRNRSPLNSGLWISVELVVNLSQIVAAIIVLSLSRNEHPRTPLIAWIIGYTTGCVFTLPHLYWRYIHRNSLSSAQETIHLNQGTLHNTPLASGVSSDIAATRDFVQENARNLVLTGQTAVPNRRRINAIVDNFKMGLDCFFAVWFVVGNVWVFGGHSSSHDAPNVYRLCIVFLAFSCIGYALPFILCALICCCLPCIISIMGFREDTGHGRGATSESINALPTYKFKSKRRHNRGDKETNLESQCNGGMLAAGTDKERIISAEDAVCCICLARFVDNEELRELPCTHFFHKDCVDKWLKINALCPLCKADVGSITSSGSSSAIPVTGSWAMV